MHSKLAGRVPLADMVAAQLDQARTKLASVGGGKAASKAAPAAEPTVEKTASQNDAGYYKKLASALDYAGDLLIKQAEDSVENGGESKQGGEQIPTAGPVAGRQPYKHDKSKHPVPTSSTQVSTKDNPGAATAMATNEAKAPGGAPYPKKGVLKTAGSAVIDRIQAKAGKKDDDKDEKDEKKGEEGEKKAAADLEYILGKIASGSEIRGGGETLDDKNVPTPKNAGRELISSNQAAIDAKKVQAKSPRKPELAEVLTEPAMTRSTDSKVHENLRNASNGGVKIAAAKVLLQKIAEEGCTCNGKSECRYCKMKAVLDKKKAEQK